jgi:hypothetical protein
MYLDPGFGGMLLQVLIAIAAAGGALLFSFRRKIRNLFSKNKGADIVESGGNADAMDAGTSVADSDNDDAVDMLSDDKPAD